ncbi:MAG: hypothetical protein P8X46_13550, partial [Nitrospirales bacterium]
NFSALFPRENRNSPWFLWSDESPLQTVRMTEAICHSRHFVSGIILSSLLWWIPAYHLRG